MIYLLNPISLTPPHAISNLEKYHELLDAFCRDGRWGAGYPPLVGYISVERWHNSSVQLLSGSHRYAAAKVAGINIPVRIRRWIDVWSAFGDLQAWRRIMNPDAPVPWE
jgi:ParB-like chromosome segregation protein Spo0J